MSVQSILTRAVDTQEQESCVLLHKTTELRTASFWKDATALHMQYLLGSILNLELFRLSVVDTARAYMSFLFSMRKQEE